MPEPAIEPEPSEDVRRAIREALADAERERGAQAGGWAEAALAEGVEEDNE